MKKEKRFSGIKAQLFRGYIIPMTAILVVFAIVVTIVSTQEILGKMRLYAEQIYIDSEVSGIGKGITEWASKFVLDPTPEKVHEALKTNEFKRIYKGN